MRGLAPIITTSMKEYSLLFFFRHGERMIRIPVHINCPRLVHIVRNTHPSFASAMTLDVETAPEEQLIELCHRAYEDGAVIGGVMGRDQVVKLSDQVAVKYGFGVRAAEAVTQAFAFQKVDPRVAHVPRVFRFIQGPATNSSGDSRGYLFMEYISGQILTGVDRETHPDIVPRVANIVAHLGHIAGDQRPGPVGGGELSVGGLLGRRHGRLAQQAPGGAQQVHRSVALSPRALPRRSLPQELDPRG